MRISVLFVPTVLLAAFCLLAAGCGRGGKKTAAANAYDSLSDEEKRQAGHALEALAVAEGLELGLFASEPVMTNPTNIDIDHRGRVWICEAYNYRAEIAGNRPREEGDRILILEDSDGDGKADRQKVFYQDKELDSPLGILVLGNKVIVSQSPFIWLLTDEDGDDRADKKEVLFQGIGGEDHDHGVHAVVFGPDGKFYFNFGNYGKQLLDKNGKPVRDISGREIDFSQYREGMLFRCDQHFENVEVLGDNFRNPYEAALDSYGTLWQSDNDDDGNRGVRINYVMPGGNYGFTDEMTGAAWQVPRTNLEDSIPYRHWHLNDPGVVPNLLQTGGGSPTGITVYEGTLLPERYRGQLIHCDAGQHVVRAYPAERTGAGYTATIAPVFSSKKDQWFRPTDVCVAPDGSLIVSDWYDPSVGGHQIGDQERGRLYRVAPPGSPYRIPKFDFSSPENALKALANPNQAARYLAWQALTKMGARAEPAIARLFRDQGTASRLRARCLWILARLEDGGNGYLETALSGKDPDLRITAIRILKERGDAALMNYLPQLTSDSDPAVRRECALALRDCTEPGAATAWAELARRHSGTDRWYLEALGIGASGQWDAFIREWLKRLDGDPGSTASSRDIIWRARSESVLPALGRLASDASRPLSERLRYFRAFDFHAEGPLKHRVLLNLIKTESPQQEAMLKWGLRHLSPAFVKRSPEASRLLQGRVEQVKGTREFLDLLDRFKLPGGNDELLSMILDDKEPGKEREELRRNAASLLLERGGIKALARAAREEKQAAAIITALSRNGSNEVVALLERIALNGSFSDELRTKSLSALAGSSRGQDAVLTLLKEEKLSAALRPEAARSLSGAGRATVQLAAARYLNGDSAENKHPPIEELVKMNGDPAKGKIVFSAYCALCHRAEGTGNDFGPDLSEIGGKLANEGLYMAIFYPDAGISFGYEGHRVNLKDGSELTGIVVSQTDEELMLKFPGGSTKSYSMEEVNAIAKLGGSMMTPGLQNAMSTEELVNLAEYLKHLK